MSRLRFAEIVRIIFRILLRTFIKAEPCENESSGIYGQRRPRSACASAQSDQGLHCPHTVSSDITKCMNGEKRPGFTLRMRRMVGTRTFCACSNAFFSLEVK